MALLGCTHGRDRQAEGLEGKDGQRCLPSLGAEHTNFLRKQDVDGGIPYLFAMLCQDRCVTIPSDRLSTDDNSTRQRTRPTTATRCREERQGGGRKLRRRRRGRRSGGRRSGGRRADAVLQEVGSPQPVNWTVIVVGVRERGANANLALSNQKWPVSHLLTHVFLPSFFFLIFLVFLFSLSGFFRVLDQV